MARRSSTLLVTAVVIAAICGLMSFNAFVSAPAKAPTLRGGAEVELPAAPQLAALTGLAVGTLPQAAHAASTGYALLQLGWFVFIVSLGPAVLFYIYFNKPELL